MRNAINSIVTFLCFFFAGVFVLIGENISKLSYGLTWIALLLVVLIWIYEDICNERRKK